MMLDLFARIFGRAAVVGWLVTFCRKPFRGELNPYTGRETCKSLIVRKQRNLSGDPWKAWR